MIKSKIELLEDILKTIDEMGDNATVGLIKSVIEGKIEGLKFFLLEEQK